MKKALKRSLSLILAITIIFSSAYVGLSEVDWDSLFVVKAKAEGESISTLNDSGSFSVTGILQDYVITVVDDSGENWISEITVDGTKYAVSRDLISHDQAKAAENKEVFLTVTDGFVTSFCTVDSVDTTASVTLYDTLKLTYKNGKFPDKKIDITGNIVNKLNLSVVDNLVDKLGHLSLTDISVTLTSDNTDIIYFKDGLLGGKKSSTTFSFSDVVTAGDLKSFSHKAYVNTSYKFPRDIQSDSFKITCTINAIKNGKSVSFWDETTVLLTNGDYGSKSNWKTQSLDSLLDQMESKVNGCPVLTEGEKVEVTASISAVQISGNLLAIKDDLDMLDTIYDMGCYVWGLEYATIGSAGAAFLDAIINECETASDELKSELRAVLKSLTNSSAFNKFIHWYFNDRQVVVRNKKQINAHCPIDITVTDEDGNTILSIVNDTVVTEIEGASAFVCDSQKTLYLPTDIDHDIKITATANGTMDYSIVEYSVSGEERVVSYSDIALTEGEAYTGSITRDALPSADKYNLSTGSGGNIESDESADFSYTVNSDGKTATITGYTGARTNVIIPSSIDGYMITSIGKSSFRNCTSLTSVTIGNSVTSIGSYAFEGCTSLTSITIPDSVTSVGNHAFYNCTSLTTAVIGNGVTSIGCFAFYGCTNLTSVNIPYNVTSIGEQAFRFSNLTSITIPKGIKSIASHTFSGCSNLAYVTIPDSVVSIDEGAFTGCSSLTSIIIPDSVSSIGDRAFYSCNKIKSIILPDNLTNIGEYAFWECDGITEVVIPASVSSIGEGAFAGCEYLEAITVDSNNTAYVCEEGVLFNKDKTTLIQYPANKINTDFIIPNSVTIVGGSAFSSCSSLTSITIPDSVTNIGDSAFSGCTKLNFVTIPNSVTSIGSSVFDYCTNLVSVTIPNSVTNIGDYVFDRCTDFKYVFYSGDEFEWNKISIGTYNDELTGSVIHFNSTGHSYDEGVVQSESTCITDGETLYTCTCEGCGHSYTETTLAPGHNIVDGLCTVCGQAEVYESAHPYENYTDETVIVRRPGATRISVVFSEETETEDYYDRIYIYNSKDELFGTYTGTELAGKRIAVDGDAIKIRLTSDSSSTRYGYKVESIDAIYSECAHENTSLQNKIPASCGFAGYTGDLCCDDCWATLSYGEYIEKLEHSFVDGMCESCGLCSACGDMHFDFTINDDGTATIVSYEGCTTDVVIPKSICGYNVTNIGEQAFSQNETITSVYVPAGVKNIGEAAFVYSYYLSEINVSPDNEYYSSVDGVLFNKDKTELICFPMGKNISLYTVPESVKTIGFGAFYCALYVNEVTVPGNVENIEYFAFIGTQMLTTINLNEGLKTIGAGAFAENYRLTNIIIPSSVTSIGEEVFSGCENLSSISIPGNITNIPVGAFYYCDNLREVTFENTLVSIEDGAFEDCDNLQAVFYDGSEEQWAEVIIGEDNECLLEAAVHYNSTGHTMIDGVCKICGYCDWEYDICDDCVVIKGYNGTYKDIIIPDTIADLPVTEIADYAFVENMRITSVTIGNNVKSIGEGAFTYCISLKSVNVSESVEEIGDVAFAYCFNLKSFEVANESEYFSTKNGILFNKEKSILICYPAGFTSSEYVISETVTTIGYAAFATNRNLETVTVKGNVKKIDAIAFAECTNLKNIIIENGVTSIGEDAFLYCASLTSIYIPASVEVLDGFVFSGCENLTIMEVDKDNQNYSALDNVLFNKDKTTLFMYLGDREAAEYIIPDGVVNIADYAFSGFVNLETIRIPDSVTCIGKRAFYYCTGLTNIILPDGVTTIGENAFRYCEKLEYINIPENVTSIGGGAFCDCESLSYIVVPDKVTDIGEGAIYSPTLIYCYENSVVHDYAVNNSLDYVLINLHSISTQVDVDYENKFIFSSVDVCTDFAEIISTSQNMVLNATESSTAGNNKLYGTGSKVSVTSNGTVVDEYTIITNGDTNGDSVCDALDAAQVALASNGHENLDGAYTLAADSNYDDMVDINDYQQIVNKAVS